MRHEALIFLWYKLVVYIRLKYSEDGISNTAIRRNCSIS